ncbi:MAG: hypothetical protein LQ342_000517 [Letrouitia transgressa]|nr:MAG: hypothetical protein LQ342_000517 [Letrouitia transgressa]
MDRLFYTFQEAHLLFSGPLLSTTLTPIAPASDPNTLRQLLVDTNIFSVAGGVRGSIENSTLRLSKAEINAWVDIYVAYWKAIGETGRAESGKHRDDWAVRVYEAWKEVTNFVIRGYTSAGFAAWTLPCLYVAGKYLRVFAIKADEERGKQNGAGGGFREVDRLGDDIAANFEKNELLEDAARVINRIFTLCISDRAPLEESRKWGLYYTTNLLFKTYFKLNSIGLSKNILRALESSRTDMPPMEAFPKSHIVTFKYYVGLIHFLDEDYVIAEQNLTSAYRLCHRHANRNKDRTLPTTTLLSPYPNLISLFRPLMASIRAASLSAFTQALDTSETAFVRRRVYLALERARELVLRNLFRKVFLLGERTERTRVRVQEFSAGVQVSEDMADNWEQSVAVDLDEIECLVAGLIYKNLMKGYISHDHRIVVLSKKGDAFPGTGV